jgi:hypothetical protein
MKYLNNIVINLLLLSSQTILYGEIKVPSMEEEKETSNGDVDASIIALKRALAEVAAPEEIRQRLSALGDYSVQEKEALLGQAKSTVRLMEIILSELANNRFLASTLEYLPVQNLLTNNPPSYPHLPVGELHARAMTNLEIVKSSLQK